MIIPNPLKIITNLDIALDYWQVYDPNNTKVNYRFNNEPITEKIIIFSDLNSNIYGMLKTIEPYSIRYIAYMIHNLTNEFYTNKYIITPYEQFISFLDLSQDIQADYNLYLQSLYLIYKDNSRNIEEKRKLLFNYMQYNINIEEINETVVLFNLPLVYYAYHNYLLYLETNDIKYLPIVILLRGLLYKYADQLFSDNKFNLEITVKNYTVKNNKLLDIVNYCKQLFY